MGGIVVGELVSLGMSNDHLVGWKGTRGGGGGVVWGGGPQGSVGH